jgi:integrase
MPRYGKTRYQLGDWYLAQRTNTPAWYRCRLVDGQVQRVSLKTADFEEAKHIFNNWWAKHFRLDAAEAPPSHVKLADVLDDYINHHAVKLRSAQTCRIFCRYWKEWWGTATVADVRAAHKQDEFREHLAARGLNPTSVARCLEIGRAAIRRAWKRGALSSFPHVEVPTVGETAPKGRPLTVEEIGKLLRGTAEAHMQLFILLMLATAGRTEAVITLTWEQVNFVDGIVKLNPEGRRQTSKRRPIVKLPGTMRTILEPMAGADRIITFRGKPIGKVDSGWHKMVKRAGLEGNVTPYSLRHTAARWMRQRGVPPWEVSAQLGHRLPGYSMTERYTAHSPDYLAEAVKALDALLALVTPAAGELLASVRKQQASATG